MDRWEYKSMDVHIEVGDSNYKQYGSTESNLMSKLNEVGDAGWEVMHILGGADWSGRVFNWIVRLKRRKP